MIEAKTIVTAIGEILAEACEGFHVSTQFMPMRFDRPAIYIEMGERTYNDIGCGMVDITANIKIDVILDASTQAHADKELLANAGNLVIAPLWMTAIGVDGGTLLVQGATTGELGNDYIPVTITVNYQDDMPTVADTYELMQNFVLTEELE